MEYTEQKRFRIPVRFFPLIFGIIHACVDATTVAVVFGSRIFHHISPYHGFLLVLTYDLLAFAAQAPFGFLVDKTRFYIGSAILGPAMALVSLFLIPVNPVLAVVVAGIGNALFHLGAGSMSLHVMPGRATAPGVFVGPGAIGLAIGIMVGKSGSVSIWPFVAVLAVCFAVAYFSEYPKVVNLQKENPEKVKYGLGIILLLLFTVTIRSVAAKVGSHGLLKVGTIPIALATAAFAGKAIGGVLADRFGWILITVGALVISAPMLAFGGNNHILIILGAFLFQMTMPVTLTAIAELMPGRTALAFGLTCLALAFGFTPHLFRITTRYLDQVDVLVLILLSAGALFVALRGIKGQVRMKF